MTDDRTREQVRVALAAEAYALPPDQLSVPAREWVDRVTARVLDAIRPPLAAPAVDREALGQLVRRVWIDWAREQPNPKLSWLVPWEELAEPDREVDRRIGETLHATGTRGQAVDREGLIELIQRHRPRPAFNYDRWMRIATEIADALIAAGQVGTSTHSLTDDEVLALSVTAKALSRRIDTALAVCDRADEFGRVMVGPIRRALTDPEGDSNG